MTRHLNSGILSGCGCALIDSFIYILILCSKLIYSLLRKSHFLLIFLYSILGIFKIFFKKLIFLANFFLCKKFAPAKTMLNNSFGQS